MICTGIFADKVGLIHGETTTFLHHIAALFIVGGYTFVMSMIIYKITDMILPLRVSAEQELDGLDKSQHGEEYAPGLDATEIIALATPAEHSAAA